MTSREKKKCTEVRNTRNLFHNNQVTPLSLLLCHSSSKFSVHPACILIKLYCLIPLFKKSIYISYYPPCPFAYFLISGYLLQTPNNWTFFQLNPSARNFFFRQTLLFFEQWKLDLLSMFLCFINYSTLTTDQRIQATLMQNLFENVHTVREEEATWSGRLPCAFFQSLPSGIPLPQPIIMMPYSIHQNSPSVVPSTPKCQSKKKEPV